MNLREKLFVEVRKGTKVTLSESDLNKMDRMYERELAQYDNRKVMTPYRKEPKRFWHSCAITLLSGSWTDICTHFLTCWLFQIHMEWLNRQPLSCSTLPRSTRCAIVCSEIMAMILLVNPAIQQDIVWQSWGCISNVAIR